MRLKHNTLEADNGVWGGKCALLDSYLFIPFIGYASAKHIMINGTFANCLLSADEKSATCELP